ncbi:unnamed protein product [Polarella glacialis]|uniref:Cyclic nucleotide-binding domain-containing protein n=1 Tax=Polarella glacialis TaxID=89957 RepID=A0A813GTJ7_POLGL|nr:unnamed protein product [Polarella glacialis]
MNFNGIDAPMTKDAEDTFRAFLSKELLAVERRILDAALPSATQRAVPVRTAASLSHAATAAQIPLSPSDEEVFLQVLPGCISPGSLGSPGSPDIEDPEEPKSRFKHSRSLGSFLPLRCASCGAKRRDVKKVRVTSPCPSPAAQVFNFSQPPLVISVPEGSKEFPEPLSNNLSSGSLPRDSFTSPRSSRASFSQDASDGGDPVTPGSTRSLAGLDKLSKKGSFSSSGRAMSMYRRKSSQLSAKNIMELHVFETHPEWECESDLVASRYELLKSQKDLSQLPRTDSGHEKLRQRAWISRGVSRLENFHMEAKCGRGKGGKCYDVLTKAISDPSRPWRIFWNLVGIFFIGYDMVYIPLQIFELPETEFFVIMQTMSVCFWSIDIPLTFLVGYAKHGQVEMNPSAIAINYLRSWFCFDFLLVSSDIVMLMLADIVGETTDAAGLVRLAKTSRALRIIRSIRIARSMKLPNNLAFLEDYITSELTKTWMGVMKLVMSIFVLNHFIACFWYGVGSVEGEDSWVSFWHLADRDVGYRYATSLHWSLTQFTPASMEITPRNTLERAFTILVIMFALVTFSSFVSSITNAMNYLRLLNSSQEKNFATLGRYFSSHNISLSLRLRVRRYLRHLLSEKQKLIHEKDVELLSHLPGALLQEVHMEVYVPDMKVHPTMEVIDIRYRHSIQRVCTSAVTHVIFSRGDMMFTQSDNAEKMVILKTGSVEYMRNGAESIEAVKEGDWLCEGALWTMWTTRGEAQAITECLAVAINAVGFVEEASKNEAARSFIATYAALFVKYINSLRKDDLTDLQDEGFDARRANVVAGLAVSVNSEGKAAKDDDDSDSFSGSGSPQLDGIVY